MTFPTIAHLKTWNSARRTAKLLQSIARKYEGKSVTEVSPNGQQNHATIIKMDWESSIGLNGEWAILIQYDNKQQSWTGCDSLILGAKE